MSLRVVCAGRHPAAAFLFTSQEKNALSRTDRVFVVHAPIRDLGEFRTFAEQAARLKPFGKVEINISTLAQKGFHDVPEGGSPWHEYASNNPAPCKFYPHEKIAPFLPTDFVAKNRKLLEAKVKVLHELGLAAAFWSYEPNFLPEAFFQKYPHLRGARSDHPRRSRKEAFAPCMDHPENLEMVTGMIATLVKNVPELGTFYFKTNDAGPGLCWSEWLYSGPNGPSHCKRRSMGERVGGFLDAINAGVAKSGGQLEIHFRGNFSEAERDDIARHLPKNCHLGSRTRRVASIGGMVDQGYPVRGILNPLGLLERLHALERDEVKTVFVDFRPSYDRGYEDPGAVEKTFDIIVDFLKSPVSGPIATLERLREISTKWGGAEHGERLFEAFIALEEAMKFRRWVLRRYSSTYAGVSMRFITRPLVAMPDKLTPDEERYFLPHVFNIHENEARMDYLDLHGGRVAPPWTLVEEGDPRVHAVDQFLGMLRDVISTLESCGGAPEERTLARCAAGLRILASIIRSANNFFTVGILRERNADKLAGAEVIPPKVGTLTGDPDLLLINACMRDELDNAAELAELLEKTGLDLVCHSETADEEDTFKLGPDLVAQLGKKMKIMRDHWLDAQHHLASPMK